MTTLEVCEAKEVIENNITERFNVSIAVRKGDALLVILFSVVLDYIIKNLVNRESM